jgi:hypothetical protein
LSVVVAVVRGQSRAVHVLGRVARDGAKAVRAWFQAERAPRAVDEAKDGEGEGVHEFVREDEGAARGLSERLTKVVVPHDAGGKQTPGLGEPKSRRALDDVVGEAQATAEAEGGEDGLSEIAAPGTDFHEVPATDGTHTRTIEERPACESGTKGWVERGRRREVARQADAPDVLGVVAHFGVVEGFPQEVLDGKPVLVPGEEVVEDGINRNGHGRCSLAGEDSSIGVDSTFHEGGVATAAPETRRAPTSEARGRGGARARGQTGLE